MYDGKGNFFIIFQCFQLISTMGTHAQACVRWLKYTTVGVPKTNVFPDCFLFFFNRIANNIVSKNVSNKKKYISRPKNAQSLLRALSRVTCNILVEVKVNLTVHIWGELKQGPCTCSAFKSFQVISSNVPCTYYVQSQNSLKRYVHVPVDRTCNYVFLELSARG